ncbi:MAG: hypothetical protein ACTSU5_02580 [Promethearchaeota archaeon]
MLFEGKAKILTWFFAGMFLGACLMLIFSAGMLGAMVGYYFALVVGTVVGFLLPTLERLGNTFLSLLQGLVGAPAPFGYMLFIVIGAGIIAVFTFLAVKYPEEKAERIL